MYVIIVGMLVLLCVSVVHIVQAYREGVPVVELPSKSQKYMHANTLYNLREYTVNTLLCLFGLLLIVAYPLTYILAYINAVVFKQYLYVKHVGIPAIKNYLKHCFTKL